jgi:riboflavin synthase
MYTGIIQNSLPVKSLTKKPGLVTFSIEFTDVLMNGLELGASVSIDGVCLTVSKMEGHEIFFDAMDETLSLTTIGTLKVGDEVNVLRSARIGDENGGHEMCGHIIGMGEVVDIESPENNHIITVKVNPDWMKYIFQKGFIGFHGASLTVVDPDSEKNTFRVHLIPETLRLTNFGLLEVGDRVNIEIESKTQAMVDTIERMQESA